MNLTNVVWVEQPIGTGFTRGNASAKTEVQAAEQFLGFWRNFVDTFDMQNRKVYICGESYAGMYIPYIADAMFQANDTQYFDLEATMMFDPVLHSDDLMRQVPAVAFAQYWNRFLQLNDTFMHQLQQNDDACGFSSYLDRYLVYPPNGTLPGPPSSTREDLSVDCDVFDAIFDAAVLVNPVRAYMYFYLLLSGSVPPPFRTK